MGSGETPDMGGKGGNGSSPHICLNIELFVNRILYLSIYGVRGNPGHGGVRGER
jgi:hypothetical protein